MKIIAYLCVIHVSIVAIFSSAIAQQSTGQSATQQLLGQSNSAGLNRGRNCSPGVQQKQADNDPYKNQNFKNEDDCTGQSWVDCQRKKYGLKK